MKLKPRHRNPEPEDYLTKEQMEKLSTSRLLAYCRSLNKRRDWAKEEQEWIDAHAMAKEILATREHVD